MIAAALLLTFAAPRDASAHVFDLASHMPPHLAAVWMVNWFGIPSSDPQGDGLDPGYGNWLATFPKCGLDNDPSKCQDFPDAGRQRWIASKRRPLAGIYSSSGRTAESIDRIDLMLSCTRRPCDLGARLDAFILQLDSVQYTSAHPSNQQQPTWDTAYRATVAFLDEADARSLRSPVWVGCDSTTYWNFGSVVGLTSQTSRKAALTADIVDMAKLAASHPSAVSVNGRPVLAFYVDAATMTPAEWQTVLDDARTTSGIDFYALGTTLQSAYFAAFDALSPWVNLGIWASATGATLYDQAQDYAKQMHAQLVSALPSNPGRVIFGGVAPGFDDYTENWGACTPREMPRDPEVLAGEMAYVTTLKLQGVIWDTWDDWTEGTEMEPDVADGPAKMLQFKQLLGTLYGEGPDDAGDQALAQRWMSYGQARSCCFEQGPCEAGARPSIDPSCSAVPPDAGSSSDAGPPSGDGGGVVPGSEPSTPATSGCGCDVVGASQLPFTWLALALLVARRRYPHGGRQRTARD